MKFTALTAGVLALAIAPLTMIACNFEIIPIGGGGCDPADPNCPGNGVGGADGSGGSNMAGVGGGCDPAFPNCAPASGAGGSNMAGAGGGPLCNPSPEVCDGIDNDCNGVIDEQNGGFLICPNGGFCINGICQNGCDPSVPETCDGLDNNCDGAIDNGATCPDPAQVCVNGSCGGCMPSPEVCDGQDNDCDNAIDDNATCPNPMQSCVNGVCQNGGGCVPSPEICDGIDNNCNGLTDEQNFGAVICPNGGSCVNGICTNCGPNMVELCDGIDNNCNGAVDENAICNSPGQICVNGACIP